MYSRFYSKKYKKFPVHFWIKREGVVLSENQGHVYWLLFYLKSYTWLFSTKDIKCSLNPQSVSLMRKFWMAHPFKAFDNAYNMVVRIINLFPESCEEPKTKNDRKVWCFTSWRFFSWPRTSIIQYFSF